ncbi:DUF4157 domain-containing protein [Ascidiimonas sp. W6]|uniref:eCIS core domain-containing protein n=1 Tax=Ascidiimonas meishanensis TaxID=3128903 RepID=UPI0030EDA88B
MQTHADKNQKNKSRSLSSVVAQNKRSSDSTFHYQNNRPKAVSQQKLQVMANNSPLAKQTAQLQVMANNYAAQHQQPIQKKENKTGMPNNLKSGIENLSGYSLDDVKVHYNSNKPAQLQAHAYAQGTDIHLGSGQEKHLPHEAWHVVQQKQGRVKPTMQMKGKVNINDDAGLEREADMMGDKAAQFKMDNDILLSKSSLVSRTPSAKKYTQLKSNVIQLATPLSTNRLNVVGENHPQTKARLAREKQYTAAHAGSANYWTESRFRDRAFSFWRDYLSDMRATADPFEVRFNNSQQFLAENAVIIKNQGDAGTNTQQALNNLNVQQKFIHTLWIYLSNMDAGFLEDRSDGFEVPRARRNEMLGYRQQIKNIAVTWQAARVALALAIPTAAPANVFAGWSNGGVVVTSEANERANYKKSIDDLGQLNVVARTAAQLSQDRSAAMNVAANNRATELGVWKVGDAHAGHMELDHPRNYNLVRLADFNADYDTWNP